jgi:hypothetical protein
MPGKAFTFSATAIILGLKFTGAPLKIFKDRE